MIKIFTCSLLVIFLINSPIFGQTQDVWLRFFDSTGDRVGFADKKGMIKIPAKFIKSTRADSFYNIIAVAEFNDSLYKSYYLLKNGRKAGIDSVYSFDFSFDCESEGKIIFQDKKKNRVGFLDQNGQAIIPAIYNYVTPFHNGLALAYRNAKRMCWDEKEDTLNCEHWGWTGGELILINEKNEILADSVDLNGSHVNWYSAKINQTYIDTSRYIQLKGRNNRVYSFLDYDKEFQNWFQAIFLPTLHNPHGNLINLLFSEITFWTGKTGWTSLDRKKFLVKFPNVLLNSLFQTNRLKQISISQSSLNELIYNKPIYRQYLNACGEHNKYRFPLFNVLLTYYKKRERVNEIGATDFDKNYEISFQLEFEFLRTSEGYKLLSAPVRVNL